MKVLATVRLAQDISPSIISGRLDEEIRASWRLFAAGTLREAYATDDPRTVIFVLEAADIASGKKVLDSLPLIQIGHFSVELTELRPFTNWARLFSKSGEDAPTPARPEL